MKFAITQPNFIPWLGYFDLLNTIDKFIVLDDTQLTRRTYMVRNKLFSSNNTVQWFSENIKNEHSRPLTCNAILSMDQPWWNTFIAKIDNAYRLSAYWKSIREEFFKKIIPSEGDSVAVYNWRIILYFCDLIGINLRNRWEYSSKLSLNFHNTTAPQAKMIFICETFNATDFYNFKNGIELGLYDSSTFKNHNIQLWKQDYQHPAYPQHRDVPFVSHLSILDLLCCVGKDSALEVIRKGSNWIKV